MLKARAGGVPEDLESLLAAAYAAEIAVDSGARLEKRVATAVERWRPQTSTGRRLVRPRGRRLVLIPVLVLLLTAVVVVTTIGNGRTSTASYESVGGYAWQHATQLGLTDIVDGYQLTLERAYVDTNRMMLAITVVDSQNRGWRQIDVGPLSVADSSGGEWVMATAVSEPVSAMSAATMFWFDYAPGPVPAGRRAFSVTVSWISVRNQENEPPANDPMWDPWHDVALNASFSFDLTVIGGAQATPGVTAEYDGATITLDRIVTSPSTIRLDLHVAGLPAVATDAPLAISVSHAGKDLGPADVMGRGSAMTVHTQLGVDDPGGDWTVTVADVTNVMGGGTWTLHFAMP